jgi:hypothetical protein
MPKVKSANTQETKIAKLKAKVAKLNAQKKASSKKAKKITPSMIEDLEPAERAKVFKRMAMSGNISSANIPKPKYIDEEHGGIPTESTQASKRLDIMGHDVVNSNEFTWQGKTYVKLGPYNYSCTDETGATKPIAEAEFNTQFWIKQHINDTSMYRGTHSIPEFVQDYNKLAQKCQSMTKLYELLKREYNGTIVAKALNDVKKGDEVMEAWKKAKGFKLEADATTEVGFKISTNYYDTDHTTINSERWMEYKVGSLSMPEYLANLSIHGK